MSESKHNPQALLAATMPALLPPGFVCQGMTLGMQMRPNPNILLLPRELMRTSVEGPNMGELEVFIAGPNGEPDGWRRAPEGMEAHLLGTPLPTEKCSVVIMAMSSVVDTLDKGIVTLDGKPRQTMQSTIGHKVIAVVPLDVFQKEHMANLRGPTT
jgi:hypothetical protein